MSLFKSKLFYLSLACGILLGYAFYPVPGIRHLVWFALTPMFVLIRRERLGRAIFAAWLCGAAFFVVGVFWLNEVTTIGYVALVLYLSVYWLLFGLLSKTIVERRHIPFWIAAPALWVFLEYARSMLVTGFPWLLLGHTQADSLYLLQICEITGVHGLSFLIVIVNAVLAESFFAGIAEVKAKAPVLSSKFPLYITAGLVGITLIYGAVRINQLEIVDGPKIAVTQGNIAWKVGPEASSNSEIWEVQRRLTLEVAKQTPAMIIWPETMVPGVYNGRNNDYGRDAMLKLAFETDICLLVGADTYVSPNTDNNLMYNSVYQIGRDGNELAVYHKQHLVPFGEYPLMECMSSFRPSFMSEFVAGSDPVIFNINDYRFGVLICFEDAFPHLARKYSLRGADFFVTATNDGWFGDSAELYQHFQLSIFRAVEYRRGFVRAANTGVSSIIGPDGQVRSAIEENGRRIQIEGILAGNVPLMKDRISTFYEQWGDWFPWFLLFLMFVVRIVISIIRFKSNK